MSQVHKSLDCRKGQGSPSTHQFFRNSNGLVKLANLPNLPNILPLKKDKCMDPKWSPILVLINLSADCLTSVTFPFTLTAFIPGSSLCCALIEAFMLGILLSLCGKKLKFTAHPSLKWLTFCTMPNMIQKWRQWEWMGRFSEVKQPQDQSNSKMGDHLGSILFFFQWQKY